MIIVTAGLTQFSVVSGMLGLGVAFAAIPFPGLFHPIPGTCKIVATDPRSEETFFDSFIGDMEDDIWDCVITNPY